MSREPNSAYRHGGGTSHPIYPANWDTLPLGGTPVFVGAATVIYVTLDQATIGAQISAAYVRLKYTTDEYTTAVVFSVGIDRRRLGL